MHSFKKNSIRLLVLLLLFLIGNAVLNMLFVPYSYVAVDYHNLKETEYDLLYVGTSHGKCGIDPISVQETSGKSGLNLCLGGEYPSYAYYMVKQACTYHIPEEIVYEIDGGYLTTDEYPGSDACSIFGEMQISFVKAEFFLDRFLAEDFRVTLFPWYNYRKEYRMIGKNVKNKWQGKDRKSDTTAFQNEGQEYREGGFIYRYPVADEAKDFANFTQWQDSEVREESMSYLAKLAEFCKEKGIRLTLIITPVPKETYEIYQDSYEAEHCYLEAFAKEEKLDFIDFNIEDTGEFSKSLESYVDREGHMNGEAAKTFSRELGKYLKEK